MKIKLFLVIVGVIFSYSLIILRFYLDKPRETGEHLELQIEDQPSIVIQVHTDFEQSSAAQVNFFYFLFFLIYAKVNFNRTNDTTESDRNMNFDVEQGRDIARVAHINLSSQEDCLDKLFGESKSRKKWKRVQDHIRETRESKLRKKWKEIRDREIETQLRKMSKTWKQVEEEMKAREESATWAWELSRRAELRKKSS
jgi:hypothetical protein